MQIQRVPRPLQERLGDDGSAALIDLLAQLHRDWMSAVTDAVGDRFERRLAEETSKLRVDMAQGFAGIRAEMAESVGNLRVDLLKWAFVFWVGQFFAVATLIGVLTC